MLKIKYQFTIFATIMMIICRLNSANAQNDKPMVTIQSIANGEHVISMVPWTVGGQDLLMVVTERTVTVNRETGPIRVLTFYRKGDEGLIKIFNLETLNSFVTAFPLHEVGGRLFVAWTSGSAFQFAVYTSDGENVKQVLETSSRGMPEFVIDQAENESILVTKKLLVNGEWRRSAASTTDIYSWDGAKYRLVANVPWNARLAASAPKAR